ncbi:hypothetical protein UlMin_028973 [Ulmus minor]
MESPKIEALYSKLYDKYIKLKNKKFNELDKLNRDQEEVFVNYVSAAEEYIEHLKSENEMLRSQVDDLRIEVDSIRVSNDEKSSEYQKLWMEESQKNEVLHEEIERLQKLQENGPFSSPKKIYNRQLRTSGELFSSSPGRMTRSKRKRSSWIETDGAVTPHATGENDAIQREFIEDAHRDTFYNGRPMNVQQPECCRRTISSSDGRGNENKPSKCMFQALVEYMAGMQFSVAPQNEGLCISAEHQSSGYSFSLTWVDNAGEDNVELLYRVSSLGTFERVAPEWMKDVIIFSTSMCPIFFERVSHVVKQHS